MQLRHFRPLAIPVFWLIAGCEGAPPADAPGGDPVAATPPTTSPERIVYSSLRPGNWDIYFFASPGSQAQRLTDHPGLDYDAAFSPDGRWVVFTSERRGHPDLYVIDLEQRAAPPRLLIDSAAMEDQAAFSPDGQTLAFVSTREGNADIFTIAFDPTRTQSLEAARNVTQHPDGDFRPDFSPDGTKIAFSSDRDTPAYGHPIFPFTRQREGEVYVMNRDGSGQTRLTESPSWDGSPEWSADGTTIYFYSDRPRQLPGPPTSPILGQEGGFRVWVMPAGGGEATAVSPPDVEALAPAVMPDGRVAYQTRDGFADWHIDSVDDAGSARRETNGALSYWVPDYHLATGAMVCHGVGPTTAETQAVEEILGAGALLAADYPVDVALPDRPLRLFPMRHTTGLAPNPRRNEAAVTIENEQGSRFVLANFDGGDARDLFTVPDVGIVSGTPNRLFDIKWSDDGSRIVYTQGFFAGQAGDAADIWVVNRDGSGRANLTEASDANDGVAAFSPDGQWIVFRSSRGGQFDLYLMNADGSNVRQLTNDAARDNFPVFSPDGRSIVFSSDKDSGTDALGFRTFDNYVLELDAGGNAGRVTRISTDPGQDSHPWFSPDGEWIVFTSERGGISDEEPMVQEVVFGPQMYGELYAYRLRDGYTQRLTHNKWEEGNPFWVYGVDDAGPPP